MIIPIQILLMVILLSFSAFFSGSETAFFSLSPLHRERLSIKRDRNSARVLELLANPQGLLVGVLSGNMFVNITATVLLTAMFESAFPGKGAEYATPIMTVLLLFIGEISPKVVAARWNIAFAMKAAPILKPIMRALFPIRYSMEKLGALIGPSGLEREELTEADLRMTIDILRRSGKWNPNSVRGLLGALELDRAETFQLALPRDRWEIARTSDTIGHIRDLLGQKPGVVVVLDGDDVSGIIDTSMLSGVEDGRLAGEIAQPPLIVSQAIQPSAFLARVFATGIRWGIIEDDTGKHIALLGLKRILTALIFEEMTGEMVCES